MLCNLEKSAEVAEGKGVVKHAGYWSAAQCQSARRPTPPRGIQRIVK
jgi:hypothetical protein